MRTKEQQALRILVRARDDFMDMRQRMDNRMGVKADGEKQDLEKERYFDPATLAEFKIISEEANKQEKAVEKMLKKRLEKFQIHTEWLANVKGIAQNISATLCSEFDPTVADTASKFWMYAGFNPGDVRGVQAIEEKKYKKEMGDIIEEYTSPKKGKIYNVRTYDMVRADKATTGYILPFNKRLRTKLIGIMATSFMRARNQYYTNFYLPYKNRLENSDKTPPGSKKKWRDVSKGHRDSAAKRYMVKMFLVDFYVAWRTMEGLPVREPYSEEYLGKKHAG